MSFDLTAKVWANSKAGGSEKLILLALADYVNAKHANSCFPSLNSLAKKTGLSRRTVIRSISKLEGMGEIQIEPGKGPNGVHLFRLTIEGGDSTRGDILTQGEDQRSDILTQGEIMGGDRLSGEGASLTPKSGINQKIKEDEDDEIPERPNIFVVWEANIGVLTPIVSEDLIRLETDYPPGWVLEAIRTAARNNGRSISYIVKVLENWKLYGFGIDPRKIKKPGRNGNGHESVERNKKFEVIDAGMQLVEELVHGD